MTKKFFAKIMLSLCLIISLIASISAPATFANALSTGQAFVIASKCNLYTSADFSSNKVTVLDEEEQPVLITLRLNDKVVITDFQDDFAFVETSKGAEGWMYKYYLTQNEGQDVYPVFNASTRNNTIVYDTDKTTPIETIQKDTRLYLYEGFDKKSDYTAVQVVLSDTSLRVGYINTADIAPDGVSKTLIVAITIIAAAVTIILSLVFIKKKKKKDKKHAK